MEFGEPYFVVDDLRLSSAQEVPPLDKLLSNNAAGNKKGRPKPPLACLPPRQPSVFPGYLSKYLMLTHLQKIVKKILGRG